MDGSVWVPSPAQRDRGGRFVAGVSGNPAGKRKGTLNRMTMLKLALSVDKSGAVAWAVIDRALADDWVAARLCFAAILPKPRSRPIELDLPECGSIEGIVAAFDVTVAAMAAGEITPDEALTVSKMLDRRRRALAARARQPAHAAAAEPAGNSAAETPAVVPPLEQAEVDLQFACIVGRTSGAHFAGDGGAAMTAADDAPLFRPTPDSCIRPAILRRAGSIEPGVAAEDDLHSACIVGRNSGAHSAGDGAPR
jgi:hypothetical protein